jgi:hypothetical protein
MALKGLFAPTVTRDFAREAHQRAGLAGECVGAWLARTGSHAWVVCAGRGNAARPQVPRARRAQSALATYWLRAVVSVRSSMNYLAHACTRVRFAGQLHQGAAAWLALATRQNKSVNTDAQGRPRLRRSNSLGAGYLQRYAAWKGQSV